MYNILEQRFQAQKITNEKSSKVFKDITMRIFNKEQIKAMFETRVSNFNISTLKGHFSDIVCSSVMSLNQNSMSKLLDLMCMGFKHQVLNSCFGLELYLGTKNAINSIRDKIMDTACTDVLKYLELFYEQNYKNTV